VSDPLRSYEEWQTSVRNFSWMENAAPGAMDVDCLIERKGQFLVIEAKPWRTGVVMPYGQHRALFQLSELENFRVYLVGEDGEDIHVALYDGAPAPIYLRDRSASYWPPERFVKTTKAKLRDMVSAWWRDAGGEAA
jgi:hypothetical protein